MQAATDGRASRAPVGESEAGRWEWGVDSYPRDRSDILICVGLKNQEAAGTASFPCRSRAGASNGSSEACAPPVALTSNIFENGFSVNPQLAVWLCFIKTFQFLRKGPKPIPCILEIYFLEQKQVAPRTASCPSLSLAGTSTEADSTYSLHYLKHFWARKWTECVTNFDVSFFARLSLVHVPSEPQIWGTWVQVDRPLDDRKIH